MNKVTKKITAGYESGQLKARLFETVLSTSADGILITDEKHDIIRANDMFYAFFDLTSQEASETNLPILLAKFNTNGPGLWLELIDKAHVNGARSSTEFTVKIKENLKYIKVNASLVKWDHEEVIKDKKIVISSWKDISENKRAEEKLRESDTRFRTIVDQSPFSIMIYLPDGRPLLVNQAAADLWGYSTNDLEYLFFNYNIFNDEHLRTKGIMSYFERAFAGESVEIPPVEYEHGRKKRATGSGNDMLWVKTYLYPARDAAGNVGLVVQMHEDITERKRVEDLTRQLLELGQSLSTAGDLNKALSLCVQAAIEVSGMDSGGAYLVDKTTGALELSYHEGLSPEFIRAASYFAADMPNTRLVMQGKPVYSEYETLFISLFPATKDPVLNKGDLNFIAIVPVQYEGKVIACLNIASHTLEKIPQSNQNALETLALQIGGIIARLQAEEALRESEERYRSLQTNIPVGIFRSTPEAKIVSANPAMVRMFGCASEEDVLAIPAVDFYLYPEQRKELLKMLKGQGIVTDFEVQLKRKNGQVFWGSFNIKGVTNKKGKIIFHDGILEDISERKKWEEAIVRAREEWERTFDSVSEMITIIDEKYKIIRANKATIDRLGITQEQIAAGLSCYRVFHNTNKPPDFCPHTRMLLDGQEHSVEMYEEHLGCDLSVTVSPQYDLDGKLIGAVHSARDITEQKKVDEELEKAEKLESLGLLAGGIAHDFNNILTSILVNINLSKVYVQDEDKAAARLIEAEKAISRAKDLTQQLLTFSRGGAPIRSRSSIHGLLKDTTEFALSGSNVKCDFAVDDNLWDVDIDEGQISQVIQNLVLNAVQAMPAGGTILIAADNLTVKPNDSLPLKEGKYIKIYVQDHGVGIPREYLKKIFDPFFSTKQKGSGLGLSTAYSIIKNHNGLIRVESELGRGSTFFVYLPAVGKRAGKKKADIEILPKGTGKILLMDDEDIILDATSDILEEFGYTVEPVKDGSQAIKRYAEAMLAGTPFDVIIMDLVVPGSKGGVETIREILKIDPEAKAVVSSGYSTDPVMANYREYGFSGAVSKPYKIRDMHAVLHQAIESKKKGKRNPSK